MKKLIQLSILLWLLCTVITSSAQSSTCPGDMPKAMLDASILNSTILWNKTIESAENNYNESELPSDLLNLCYAYYGAIGNSLYLNDSDRGQQLVQLGLEASANLSAEEDYKSLGQSLKGGFKGLEIAFSPMKGMILGPESDRLIAESLELNNENAFAWLQKGSSQYNTPKLFGGSVPKSIESFKKSIECYEKSKNEHIWLKLEAMVWLGQAYHNNEEYTQAKNIYEEVLVLAPGYQWVEKHLLPKTLKKIKQ